MRSLSLSEVLDLVLVDREKQAQIATDPRGFFVHVRVPDHVADRLREVQRQVIPDQAQHQDIDHITLVYTQKAPGDHPVDRIHSALSALRGVGGKIAPIQARLQGWGYFDGASDDGKPSTALVALVDAPGLEHLHVDMCRALRDAGIKPSDTHIFTPHITLGYLGQHGRSEAKLPPVGGEFMIDKAHVAARDVHEIPLSGTAKATASPKAAALVRREARP